jgi:hypothetical protein
MAHTEQSGLNFRLTTRVVGFNRYNRTKANQSNLVFCLSATYGCNQWVIPWLSTDFVDNPNLPLFFSQT